MRVAGFARWRLAWLAGLVLGGLSAPAARAEVVLPGDIVVQRVDFERHVMGLLGRLGCNAGACHGSFQGKGGFRLSLFGYDPGHDHAALARDLMGRRVNLQDPDRSLCLLKPTGQVAHGGGRRFAVGSWQYRLLREWVAGGARWRKGSGNVADMQITPAEDAVIRPEVAGRVRVRVRFKDGSEEDVTPLCDFRVQDDAVAEAPEPGVVMALRPGDTALVVSYRGNVRAIRVLVPMPTPHGFRYPEVPEVNFIDREVFAKLRRLNMVPSDLAGDAEFLRRVTIDTIGCIPSPEEVRAFQADRSPDKRARLIDRRLTHPLHAALWATKFSDITGNNTNALRAPKGPLQVKYSQMWQDWFRRRLADNVSYDEIVRGVLCATSRDGLSTEDWMKEVKAREQEAEQGFVRSYVRKPTLDLFWQVGRAPTLEQYAERTAAAFLGVHLECAQCHKHPFDRWTQADYRAFANVFGQVAVGVSPQSLQILNGGNKGGLPKGKFPKGSGVVNEVFLAVGKVKALPPPDFVPVVKKVIINAKGKKLPVLAGPPPRLPARALGGPEIPTAPGKDARIALFDWLRSPDNPYFARSFVNRVWGHYFGVGIVDPVDSFAQGNPPSNARLLDALSKDFVDHHFDIRRLERMILNSRVYQLSSTMNDTNKLDRNNFAHSYVRAMMAEVVVDVLNAALGVREDLGADAPPGSRAIEVASTRVFNPNLAYAFRIFGRPDRNLACECERDMEPALPQTLYLMTDPVVQKKLRSQAPTAKGNPAPVKGKPVPTKKPVPVKEKPVPAKKAALIKGGGKGGLPPQDGRLARLLKSGKNDAEILDELFLATLTRFPTEAEKKYFAEYRAARRQHLADAAESPKAQKQHALALRKEREETFADALWALINTREFVLNH
jgi:hypothetical protein